MHGAKFPPSNANLGRLSINNVHKITEFVDLNVQYLVYSSHCSIYLGYFLTSPPMSLWTSYIKAPCPFRRRCRASRVQIPWRKALHSPQFSSLSPSRFARSVRPSSLRRRCCCSASARFSAASGRPSRRSINYVASERYRVPTA